MPGRVIPRNRAFEAAIRLGKWKFTAIGCANCHVSSLPLTNQGWIYTEPNPYDPIGNLRLGDAPILSIDLTSDRLPQPRLKPDRNGVVHVPAFTDVKLHDICAPGLDPNAEPLDKQHAPGSPESFRGNRKFLTKKLWGAANEPPFFHHGKFTTLREATLADAGEALASRTAFQALPPAEQPGV